MARKPISVWIGQVLIAVFGLFVAGVLIYDSITQWPVIIRAFAKNQELLLIALLDTAAKLTAIAFIAWTVVLISKRSRLGRWLGLLCLAGVLAVVIYANLHSAVTYDNPAQRGGASIFNIILLAAYMTLMVRFGLSKASKLYFVSRRSFDARGHCFDVLLHSGSTILLT